MLTEEERALWDGVARQVKPLGKRRRPVKSDQANAADPTVANGEPASARPPGPPRPVQPAPAARPAKSALPPLVPLNRRERSRLSRGKEEIEARLDLHGMTQSHAHGALISFLHRAHHEGLSFVLVITGKGRSGGHESDRGVLRRQVPLWLSQPELRALIVGFEEAHVGHGGQGALYVRVRRARS